MRRYINCHGVDNWDSYARTVLELGEAPLVIDLRHELPDALVGELRGLGLGDAFAVFTASNPRDRKMRANENRRRNRRLATMLDFSGLRWIDGVGRDPENVHRERSLAVACSKRVAVTIAANYGQNAIFWFDGERFWIVGALEAGRIVLPAGPE